MQNQENTPQGAVRTISTENVRGKLDVSALVLIAILLAAGVILNATVGKALAITGIQPEFCIAAFCIAILLIRPSIPQAIIIGILGATVIQLTTSIPGLEYLCDIPASAFMGFMAAKVLTKKNRVYIPFVGTFITTLISGSIFATVATIFLMGAEPASILVMAPIVLGTALANAIVVQALYFPLAKAAKREL